MLDSAYAILHAAHLRVTRPRLVIAAQLLRMRNHRIAADVIYRHLLLADDAVSLTTCHRVLRDLEKNQVLTRETLTGRRWIYLFKV